MNIINDMIYYNRAICLVRLGCGQTRSRVILIHRILSIKRVNGEYNMNLNIYLFYLIKSYFRKKSPKNEKKEA